MGRFGLTDKERAQYESEGFFARERVFGAAHRDHGKRRPELLFVDEP